MSFTFKAIHVGKYSVCICVLGREVLDAGRLYLYIPSCMWLMYCFQVNTILTGP